MQECLDSEAGAHVEAEVSVRACARTAAVASRRWRCARDVSRPSDRVLWQAAARASTVPSTAELRTLEARLRAEADAAEAQAATAALLARVPGPAPAGISSSGCGGGGDAGLSSPSRRPMGAARFVAAAEAPREGAPAGGLPPVPARPGGGSALQPAAAAAAQPRPSRALRLRADVDEARHLT
jgi:hypothetical protein